MQQSYERRAVCRTNRSPLVSPVIIGVGSWAGCGSKDLNYYSDIKPIIDARCATCHVGIHEIGSREMNSQCPRRYPEWSSAAAGI